MGPLSLERPTRARYLFLAYAASLSLILYLDRVCISKSGESIARELGLNKAQLGYVFSAFTLGYLLFEVPTGAWGDRHGPKRVLVRIVVWWSLFTALTGCIWNFTLDSGRLLPIPGLGDVPLLLNGFLVLLLIRFLFGAGEAGAFPNIAKCAARWFPLQERGFAQGVVTMASRVGGGISAGATVLVTAWANSWEATHTYLGPDGGWRITFILFGLLGIVWAIGFGWWFRDHPCEHPSVNAAERDLIEARGPDQAAVSESVGHAVKTPWRSLLTSWNLAAYSAMAFCSAFVVYLYFTHFPGYLKERHQVTESWSWVAGLPLIGGAIGCSLGGYLTDRLLRQTGSRRWSRRLMGLCGKGGGAVLLFLGAQLNDPASAVVCITLSAFASDLALASHWAVCSDTAGRHVATVFGIMNTLAGLGGTLSSIVAGHLVESLSPTAVGDVAARARAWDLMLMVFAGTLALSALCWLRIDAEEPIGADPR